MVRDKRASEFGGVPGRIQPAPHEPTNAETLSQIYGTEPSPVLRVKMPEVKATLPRIRPDEDPETFTPATQRRR